METKKEYTYSEVETFGQLMIGLPGVCRAEEADGMSSSEIIQEIFRVACDFDEEWRKLTPEEHEDGGEDYIVEVDKLADWIAHHLYDVLHNRLEYPYMAMVTKYVVGFDPEVPGKRSSVEFSSSKKFDSRCEAAHDMIAKATSLMSSVCDGTMVYLAQDHENGGLPSCTITGGVNAKYVVKAVKEKV